MNDEPCPLICGSTLENGVCKKCGAEFKSAYKQIVSEKKRKKQLIVLSSAKDEVRLRNLPEFQTTRGNGIGHLFKLKKQERA